MFNKPSEKINLNSPDPNSDIYISEGERFNKDFAAYDYNRRNIEHERKKEMYQNRKTILYERERKRWEKMDYEYLKAENRIMMNKERNLVGRKNNPGMAFNPLTLQYDNSVQGEILKRRDDESKFRALMRATNIDKHANAGYNIINGEERTIMENRMLNEIEPNIYKKNIDKINQINQRHNDNDNFYTKGPSYSQTKRQFAQIKEQNDNIINNNEQMNKINNEQMNNNIEYQQIPKENFNNIPQNESMNPNNIDNRNMPSIENKFNNIPPCNNNNYQSMNSNEKYNNISPQDNQKYLNEKEYQRKTPENQNNNYNNILPNENYQRMTPQNNYKDLLPNDNYQRMTPQNNYKDNIPPNENYLSPSNENYQRITPYNNNENIPDMREYRKTPYSENNYRRKNPSDCGFSQIQRNEMINNDHYSEQDKYDRRFQTFQQDFDRQYNYIGNQEKKNYEDYKNQEYNNGIQTSNNYYPSSQNFNQKNGNLNANRDVYARPDYYANNRPRTKG